MIIDPNGIGPAGRDTSLAAPLAQARAYARASRAPATRLAYRRDWAAFTAWCHARDQGALPADPRLVALFLAHEAARGLRPSSIGRRLAAIALPIVRPAACRPGPATGGRAGRSDRRHPSSGRHRPAPQSRLPMTGCCRPCWPPCRRQT
ncbi:site-specific integrase [Komagataeibacter rhaeticus]|nr:site-specific integrase [Komagataeibacter rhaeticus]